MHSFMHMLQTHRRPRMCTQLSVGGALYMCFSSHAKKDTHKTDSNPNRNESLGNILLLLEVRASSHAAHNLRPLLTQWHVRLHFDANIPAPCLRSIAQQCYRSSPWPCMCSTPGLCSTTASRMKHTRPLCAAKSVCTEDQG